MAYQSMMGYENIATPMSMFSPQWVGVSPSLPANIPLGSLVDGNPYIQQDTHNPFYQQVNRLKTLSSHEILFFLSQPTTAIIT